MKFLPKLKILLDDILHLAVYYMDIHLAVLENLTSADAVSRLCKDFCKCVHAIVLTCPNQILIFHCIFCYFDN